MVKILNTGKASALKNMEKDLALLETLENEPVLHFYDWEAPSLTYGYFIQPGEHLNEKKLQDLGIAMARRPTGGGIIFHIWDLAFSFLMPSSHAKFSLNTLENYQFVNQAVLKSVKKWISLDKMMQLYQDGEKKVAPSFCMAKPTLYDVVYEGMKVAGSAQRRTKKGYLHQGSVSLALPDNGVLSEVLLDANVLSSMQQVSFAPLQKPSPEELSKARLSLQHWIQEELCAAL